MANLVSNKMRQMMLDSFFKGSAVPLNLYLRLYQDGANIVEGTTLSDIKPFEQTGGGYSPIQVPQAQWKASTVVTGGVQIMLNDQTWTSTADDWKTMRWVVLSTTADDTGFILMARDYGMNKSLVGTGATAVVDDLYYQISA